MRHQKVYGAVFSTPGPTRVVVDQSRLSESPAFTHCSPGMELSRCSGGIAELLAKCQEMASCVLVVSQESLEKIDANEFSAYLGAGSSVRVLVMGAGKNPRLVERWLSMGCMGYLPQNTPSPTFRRAVRAIASGQVWADRTTITHVMKTMILKESLQGLTSREREILRLIASGLSNRAIADRLYIAHETVRWHIRALYSKLGVQDRFSAVVYAKRLLDSELLQIVVPLDAVQELMKFVLASGK